MSATKMVEEFNNNFCINVSTTTMCNFLQS